MSERQTMSAYKKKILAFIEVLKSGLIPELEKQNLNQLPNYLPNNERECCEEIDKWLKVEERGAILKAYDDNLGAIVDAKKPIELGPGNIQSDTPLDQPGETLKELLANALQPVNRESKPSESEEE